MRLDVRSMIIAILFTLKRCGKMRVGRTRLMKLLYLVDRICKERLGEKCVNTQWIMWWYGPFSKEVLDALDQLSRLEIIDEEIRGNVDSPAIVYSLRIALDPEMLNIPEEVRNIINEVVERWGREKLSKLLEYVYSLPEVEKAELGDYIE